MNFSDLGLSEPILRAVDESGYTIPTPVQQQAIPQILMGRDLLGIAPTGTGKTAGFILPMLDILSSGRTRARMPRSIILSPTRELATQIAENFDIYGKYCTLTKALLIGGVGFEDQERLLDRGVDVLIATPGRLMDHHQQGRIMLNDVKLLVIDEADRMLDMGFIPDIEKIVSALPTIRQTLMFSATMPNEISRLANKFLMNPREVKVEKPASADAKIEQFFIRTNSDFKARRSMLRDLIKHLQVKNAFIFCNRKKDVDVLAKSLKAHGFNAGAMHGDMDQYERNKIFEAFKGDQISLLVCSDVAARGLDVMDVSHVINFDVPFSVDDYVHRIGRTGRAGKTGVAVMLVSKYDEKYFEAVQKLAGEALQILPNFDASSPASSAEPEAYEPRMRRKSRHPFNRKSKDRRPHSVEPETAPAQVNKAAERESQPNRPGRNHKSRQHSARGGDGNSGRDQRRAERNQVDDNKPSPKGLGDHVPAFLMKK